MAEAAKAAEERERAQRVARLREWDEEEVGGVAVRCGAALCAAVQCGWGWTYGWGVCTCVLGWVGCGVVGCGCSTRALCGCWASRQAGVGLQLMPGGAEGTQPCALKGWLPMT